MFWKSSIINYIFTISILYDIVYVKFSSIKNTMYTVKPRPEAHMDMIHFEVFLKNIHMIHKIR